MSFHPETHPDEHIRYGIWCHCSSHATGWYRNTQGLNIVCRDHHPHAGQRRSSLIHCRAGYHELHLIIDDSGTSAAIRCAACPTLLHLEFQEHT